MANPKKAAVGFIFITVLIDIIGFGIIIPRIASIITAVNACNGSNRY